MIWPQLVPDAVCTTPIRIVWTSGVTADGAPAETTAYTGRCNYAEKSREILDAERRLVRLEAVALLPGDPLPGQDISGTAVIGDGRTKRRIYRASRARNPDGTVNFTQLELM